MSLTPAQFYIECDYNAEGGDHACKQRERVPWDMREETYIPNSWVSVQVRNGIGQTKSRYDFCPTHAGHLLNAAEGLKDVPF